MTLVTFPNTLLGLAHGVGVLGKQMLLIGVGVPAGLMHGLGLTHGVLVVEIGVFLIADVVVRSIADEPGGLGKVLFLSLLLGLLGVCAVTHFFAHGLHTVLV